MLIKEIAQWVWEVCGSVGFVWGRGCLLCVEGVQLSEGLPKGTVEVGRVWGESGEAWELV